MEKPHPDRSDIYVTRFLNSPAYIMVMKKTIETAKFSYDISRILSIILFFVGALLIIVAIIFGFMTKQEVLPIIFGGLGTANIIALLLYKPIERIQSGVNELIKSQVACLSYLAQYDSINRTLATWSELPLNEVDLDKQKEFALFLRGAGTQLINDLNQIASNKS